MQPCGQPSYSARLGDWAAKYEALPEAWKPLSAKECQRLLANNKKEIVLLSCFSPLEKWKCSKKISIELMEMLHLESEDTNVIIIQIELPFIHPFQINIWVTCTCLPWDMSKIHGPLKGHQRCMNRWDIIDKNILKAIMEPWLFYLK